MLRPMTTSAAAFIPWTDRAGRFSALRAAVFAAALAPGLWLTVQGWLGLLGPRALTAATHDTGDWAVRFLLLALLVTPLRSLTRRNELIGVRRMLGLAGLGYVLVHAALYVVDQRFDLVKVMWEIALRTYLTIGFVGLLGLAALGATSTDGMVKRLGAERWGRLHALVYGLTVLAQAGDLRADADERALPLADGLALAQPPPARRKPAGAAGARRRSRARRDGAGGGLLRHPQRLPVLAHPGGEPRCRCDDPAGLVGHGGGTGDGGARRRHAADSAASASRRIRATIDLRPLER
jgi:DMSO/TMAO reductase YedYZ heme-binding membrane subunit